MALAMIGECRFVQGCFIPVGGHDKNTCRANLTSIGIFGYTYVINIHFQPLAELLAVVSSFHVEFGSKLKYHFTTSKC